MASGRSQLGADPGLKSVATATVAAAQASIFVWAGRTGGSLAPDSVAQLQEILAEDDLYCVLQPAT